MCSPAVGVLVADLLEGNLEERVRRSLGWRPKTAKGRYWFATQGRFGGAGRIVDLNEIGDDEWVEDQTQ
jgi:sarcosine oxidase/L-pipecolate oxidase